jgi:predicted DCC family thiol-disulfide oxidoreductase YuxK
MTAPITFFNARCPVCSAGVAHIRRLTGVPGDDRLWVDITAQPVALQHRGVTVEAVKKRLHVIDREGVLRIGIPAFAALWDEVPRYRGLARFVRLPMVREISAVLYEALAIVLYVWNKRRERRQTPVCWPGNQAPL